MSRDAGQSLLSTLKSPFEIQGASNIFLETVKRGEDDKCGLQDTETTVILRIYEAYGGHGQALLKIARQVPVHKAFVTNLLEDEVEELELLRADGTDQTGAVLKLGFRGFEVKTVKLIIGSKESSYPVLQE